MHYDLLAIDLDGTLLSPDGKVSDANRDAIARAQAAGAVVVPCTGRAWHESHWAIDNVPGLDRGIFVTGALINDMKTGQTLEAVPFEEAVTARLVELLADLPEAVLVFRDRDQAGHDYLVTGQGELVANTAWWFEHSKAKVHTDRSPAAWDACVRVAMVSRNGHLSEAEQRVRAELGDAVNAHRFGGIARQEKNEQVEILEIFPAGVDKWRGVRAVAAHHGVPLDRVAVIGDEVNDVSMLTHAACGIAMGNAAEPAAAVADRRTLTNEQDGVAYAIDQLLSGAW